MCPNINCSAFTSLIDIAMTFICPSSNPQKVEFTLGGETESKDPAKKKVMSGEELTKQLDRLLQDQANNQRIIDWVEVWHQSPVFLWL